MCEKNSLKVIGIGSQGNGRTLGRSNTLPLRGLSAGEGGFLPDYAHSGLKIFISIFDQSKSYPRLVGTSGTFDATEWSTALVESASFLVKIEDQIVAQSNNFFEAFAVVTAAYYVFNLAYPKTWKVR